MAAVVIVADVVVVVVVIGIVVVVVVVLFQNDLIKFFNRRSSFLSGKRQVSVPRPAQQPKGPKRPMLPIITLWPRGAKKSSPR